MNTERKGPFKKFHSNSYRGELPDVGPEIPQAVDLATDSLVARNVPDFPLHKVVPPMLVRGDFQLVLKRAYAVLVKAQRYRQNKHHSGPFYGPSGLRKMAEIAACFHVARHTPRDERPPDWPKDAHDLAALFGIEVEHVREAIYQSQYHRWEDRYLPKSSSTARVSQIKDSLLHNVLRQDEVDDPAKVNANLYRTALQAEGAMMGTQKQVQVNVNSNVLNYGANLTEDQMRERLDRVNRLATQLRAREQAREVEARTED